MQRYDDAEQIEAARIGYEEEARARLQTREGRIEAITFRAYSRRFGAGNSNYIRECADDEYELIGFLADAEARIAQLEEALVIAHGISLPSRWKKWPKCEAKVLAALPKNGGAQ